MEMARLMMRRFACLVSDTKSVPAISSCMRIYNRCAVGNRFINNEVKWSYSMSPGDVPFLGNTIGNLLETRAEEHPDRDAIVFCDTGIRRTYEQFQIESDKMAAGLVALGMKAGERIGVWSSSNLEWLLTMYAAARLGLILVSINPAYKASELEYCLNKVTCKAIVVAEEYRGSSYYDLLLKLIPELEASKSEIVSSERFPFLKHIITIGDKRHPGTVRFQDVHMSGRSEDMTQVHEMQKKIQLDDPASIQFTSGTTGRPKGATLSHHQMVNNAYFTGRRAGYHEKEVRACITVPIYHTSGISMIGVTLAVNGNTVVVPSAAFNATAVLNALQNERCNQFWAVPTMYVDVINHPDINKYNLTALQQAFIGASPCTVELMNNITDKLNITDISVLYGMTECSTITFQSRPTDPLEKRLGTIGYVSAYTEAKVVDNDDNIVPVGTRGQLCTRGYSSMLGYWKDPVKTAEVYTPDRWLHTGDMAIMDEEGYCQIVGRSSDMIIRGGVNIYPAEIENLLHSHPKIRDAQLGEPIRLCLGYVDVEYEDKRYTLGKTMETIHDEWKKEKFSHGFEYPNLPYLIDGDTKITQSNAILRYLGRKYDLLGKTEDERQKCDTTLEVAVDLQQELIKNIFSPTFNDNKEKLAKSLDDKLKVMEAAIRHKWIAGPNITVADFRMYQALDEYRHLSAAKAVFNKYPKIQAYLQRFETQPNLAKYMASDKYKPWPLFPSFVMQYFERN